MAGIATVTVAVMVIVPMPEFAAALKNFCAVVLSTKGDEYETEFVGSVQEPTQAGVGVVLIFEAAVESVCEPVVKVVDVIVRFQPAPLPLLSTTVNPKV